MGAGMRLTSVISVLLVAYTITLEKCHGAPLTNATSVDFFNTTNDVSTNVCNTLWYYCPKDPGCTKYANSVKSVVVHANGHQVIKSEELKPGDQITLVISGITSWATVPSDGNYLIYDGAGKNLKAGPLVGAFTISGGHFVLTIDLTLDAASASGNMFEFGVDIFSHKSEGDPEGMCIQIASPEHYRQESSKTGFQLDCKDNGDGTWTPGASPVVPHPLPAPSCAAPKPPPPPSSCKLNWFYCPRDPGCVTYTMSVSSVEVDVQDKSGIKAGDTVTMIVHGTTKIKAVPSSGTYKVYDGAGKNAAQGILSDVMTIDASSGAFTIKVSGIVLDASSVQGDVIEWGLDIFQDKSGSNEGMCVQVASDAYVKMVQPKASPPFVTYCADQGHGVFVKKTIPDPVHTAQCHLES